MTGSTKKTEVPVQWALQGKGPDDRGYRLLASSTGEISARNFDEILDRFSPGTLDRLPQVAVSYVPGVNGTGYLSMAFHEDAAGSLDRLGREVTFTRYFCVPYLRLAAGAMSYLAMYEAFQHIRLPDRPAAPFTVELCQPATAIPAEAMRALLVTELLLTGNPVCIVQEEPTSVRDRLTFIDAVMTLLPYGMRAEMAAATWTSSSYRLHKFRLSFSDAPRRTAEAGVGDHLVRWQPDQTVITRAAGTPVPEEYGSEYRQWLQPLLERSSIPMELAQQTSPRAFKAADIDQMLDGIQNEQRKHLFKRRPRQREIAAVSDTASGDAANSDGVNSDAVRAPVPRGHDAKQVKYAPRDSVENLIYGAAVNLNHPDRGVRDAGPFVHSLREELDRRVPPAESRERYRELIARCGLLRDDLPVAKSKKTGFYKVLLLAAFGEAIGYADYCRIEEMLNEKLPERPLLQAIDEMRDTDLRLLFIVRYNLKRKSPKDDFSVLRLLRIVADPQLREDHAELIWGAMIVAIREARADAIEQYIIPKLRERGFLANDLYARAPMNLKLQVSALADLLGAVYRDRQLEPDAFQDIFMGPQQNYPTLALMLAVCRFTAPADSSVMLTNFVSGLAESLEVPEDARSWLRRLGHYRRLGGDSGNSRDTSAEVSASRDDTVTQVSTVLPAGMPNGSADAPKEKGWWERRLRPSGSFSVAEEKSKQNDEQ